MKTESSSLPRSHRAALTSALLLASLSTGLLAQAAPTTVQGIFDQGKFHLDSRLRFEHFHSDPSSPRDGDGFSLRTRFGFTTAPLHGFHASIEAENVEALSSKDEINPLDAAGTGTHINQFWGAYTQPDLGSIKVGRQIYTLDDHRFIGHVGWRQNIQTFDAATAKLTPLPGLALQPFYIGQVNRVNGQSTDLDGFGLNAAYTVAPGATLAAFGYSLDFDQAPAFSNDTVGLRLTGSLSFGESRLNYSASYAHQWDNSGNAPGADFSLGYYAAEVSAVVAGFTVGAGLEILEGDGAQGFRTPLATVHAFQGFVDIFAGPSLNGGLVDGLSDYYALVGYRVPVGKGIPVRVIYHYFETERDGKHIGDELDVVLSYAITKNLSFLSKYGLYWSNDSGLYDTNRDQRLLTFDLTFTY